MKETIDVEDHYNVLGLTSGEKGAKLTEKQIRKAYLAKALELQAHNNFKRLHESYRVLKNETSRKEFDKFLRDQKQRDSKRQKLVADLEARERAAKFERDARLRQEKRERMKRKFDEECATSKRETGRVRKKVNGGDPCVVVAPTAEKYDQPERVNNLCGVGFRKFEDDVLKKLPNAAQKQKLETQGA